LVGWCFLIFGHWILLQCFHWLLRRRFHWWASTSKLEHYCDWLTGVDFSLEIWCLLSWKLTHWKSYEIPTTTTTVGWQDATEVTYSVGCLYIVQRNSVCVALCIIVPPTLRPYYLAAPSGWCLGACALYSDPPGTSFFFFFFQYLSNFASEGERQGEVNDYTLTITVNTEVV